MIDSSVEAFVVDVDDDEQEEEEEDREEGGEGEGEGEGRFYLRQEYDSRAVRERKASEWPPHH